MGERFDFSLQLKSVPKKSFQIGKRYRSFRFILWLATVVREKLQFWTKNI